MKRLIKLLILCGLAATFAACDQNLIKALPLTHLLLESDDTGDIDAVYHRVSSDTSTDCNTLSQHVATNIHHLLTAFLTE